MIPTDAKVYEVLALAMRYFFTLMGVMIVWRAFSWLSKDRKLKHRRLKQLPDAGTIGILTVEAGSKQLKPGEVIPVPHEGVLGYLRTCDVVVPVDEVATMHLDFTFVDGKGLYIYPRRGCEAVVDGMLLANRRDSQRCPMQHGSTLEIGQAVLRLGVFAGLNVKEAQPMSFSPEDDYPIRETYVPPTPPPVYPPYPPQQSYSPYQQAPYQPQNPPVQPPYAPPFQPVNNPWQGGDDDAQ
ncbi:MAG: hypothetical protein E7318_08480 [Clostridiales bacterium]|nr:hypothetical protein [Clostridiales bacterium]